MSDSEYSEPIGSVHGISPGVCSMCAGYAIVSTFDVEESEPGTEPCPACDGTGRDKGPNAEHHARSEAT